MLINATHAVVVLQSLLRQSCTDPPLAASWVPWAHKMQAALSAAIDTATQQDGMLL